MRQTEHTFHIPVMGAGFTVDTPIKVAHYGIDSVMAMIDHNVIDKLREHYCKERNYEFEVISEKDEDCRAKRLTAYVNLIHRISNENFEALKNSPFEEGSEIVKYFELLPDSSKLRLEYERMLRSPEKEKPSLQSTLRKKLTMGSIDVNIMTKLDRAYYDKEGNPKPIEYNDAHSALRGYANSTLDSSLVLSAGLNPRLFSYIANFDCFFPDEQGNIQKKIVLKVSDYRSALIQGKFLAKKGLWISEYRIESGLNCGGHAFATEGYLLGPILGEFETKKQELLETIIPIFNNALEEAGKTVPTTPLSFSITVQGGVGNANEHNFLLRKYKVDSVGWGTPFLLVPEVVNVDEASLKILCDTTEEDLYLSYISPMGISFNAVKGDTKDIERMERIAAGKPGSPCVWGRLVFNTEYTERPICVASRQYQNLKIKDLESQNITEEEYNKQLEKTVAKTCICMGLSNATALIHGLQTKDRSSSVTVCAGPNMAYYSKIATLREMVDHIYGRGNLISVDNRPNMFVKELEMYVNYLSEEIDKVDVMTERHFNRLSAFRNNLYDGIKFYRSLIREMEEETEQVKTQITDDLSRFEKILQNLSLSEPETA